MVIFNLSPFGYDCITTSLYRMYINEDLCVTYMIMIRIWCKLLFEQKDTFIKYIKRYKYNNVI